MRGAQGSSYSPPAVLLLQVYNQKKTRTQLKFVNLIITHSNSIICEQLCIITSDNNKDDRVSIMDVIFLIQVYLITWAKGVAQTVALHSEF